MHAEAGEAEVLRQARVLQATLAVIEHGGIVGQFLRLTIHHLIHPYRALVVQAQMKELHLETPALLGPERVVGAVADGLILIIVEGLHRVGDMAHRRLVDSVG